MSLPSEFWRMERSDVPSEDHHSLDERMAFSLRDMAGDGRVARWRDTSTRWEEESCLVRGGDEDG